MPDRWRLGTRDPNTVWSVADEHLVGSFGTEEDARRAVDAVNAQAGETASEVLHRLGSASGPGWRRTAHCCEEMTRRLAETCDEHPHRWDCPDLLVTGPPESNDYGLWVHDGGSSYIVIRHCPWCGGDLPSDEHETSATPPSCDCPTTDGADPAGSAVGQRGAPTREALVEAIEGALAGELAAAFQAGQRHVPGVTAAWDTQHHARRGAERMADVALAALRDGGADGGEDEGPFRVVGEGGREYPGPKAPRDVDLDACPIYPCSDSKAVEAQKACRTWKPCDHDRRTLVGEIARLRAVVGWVKANDHVHTWQVTKRLGKDYGRASAEIARLRGELARMRSEEREDVTKLRGKVEVYRQLAAAKMGPILDRLSSALGVSLDPDDPDPVERLVEAAGKAREVEVVSCDEANQLPPGSVLLPFDEDLTNLYLPTYRERSNSWATAGIAERSQFVGSYRHWRVIYRAPALAPAALAVGEVVESAADLDRRASVGTIVEDASGDIDKRGPGGWRYTELAYPVTVVRVGTGGGQS